MVLDSLDRHRGGLQEVLSSRHEESSATFRIGDFNSGIIGWGRSKNNFFHFS